MSKRACESSVVSNRKRVKSHNVYSDDTKNVITNLANAYMEDGNSISATLAFLERAGYPVSQSALYKWLKQSKEGTLVSAYANCGRRASLSREQYLCLIGWILDVGERDGEATAQDGVDFVLEQFGIKISVTTVCRYFASAGIVLRRKRVRSGKFVQHQQMLRFYTEFVNSLPQSARNGRLILSSVDFTYTSHRSSSQYGWALAGSPAPKIGKKISRYTNCLCTLVYSDGTQSPCYCFTYNPAFAKKAGNSKRAVAHNKKRAELFKKWEIKEARVIYLKGESKGSKYVREQTDFLGTMLAGYERYPHHIMFSDNGNCFFKDGDSIIEDLGKIHLRCAPEIHQFVSPNDNKLHAVAKRVWRTNRKDFSDDVDSTLHLMHCLDAVSDESIKSWFTTNMFLDGRMPTTDNLEKIIGVSSKRRSALYAEACAQFDQLNGKRCNDPNTYILRMNSFLDGSFWTK